MPRPALEKADVLLLQLEVPLAASLAAAAIVRAQGGTVILDPAPAPEGRSSAEVLKAVDIITPNETEAGLILGWQPQTPEEGLKAAKELRARGVATAVVKLGVQGPGRRGPGIEAIIPAFKVTPIDTVAAGDSFNGGLAHALEQGRPLEQALRYAAACGALSTTKKGASAAAPTRPEVEAFLAQGLRPRPSYSTLTVAGSHPLGSGYFGFISSSVSRTMRAMAALRTQLRSAGITCHGACAVEQRVSAVS